jgi:hypothetical protein
MKSPRTRVRSPVLKIVSGGQTGVDRAALDVAIALGLAHGGWCPQGRRAEDGPINPCYHLCETDSPRYHVRTRRNVLESDGTLILYGGQLIGGTALTLKYAQRYERPSLAVDLEELDAAAVLRWLDDHAIEILNVAGPRESTLPGIYEEASKALRAILRSRARKRKWRGKPSERR